MSEWLEVAQGTTGSNGFFAWCKSLRLGDEIELRVWRRDVTRAVALKLDRKVTIVPVPAPG